METTFVLDALEQALWARRPSGTIHHSDKGSQYVSLAYKERLKEAKLLASTGSTGDSYDNAMTESINGLYKAEVIHRKSWKNRAEVELATLTWVGWYNNRRLLGRLGHIPPVEAEKAYYSTEWKLLWVKLEGKLLPSQTPTLKLVKLGRWHGSKRTGRLGWVVMWDGWFRLQDMVEGYLMMKLLDQEI